MSETLRRLFADHYWDSFERDKELILKHIDAVLALAAPSPAPAANHGEWLAGWNAGFSSGAAQPRSPEQAVNRLWVEANRRASDSAYAYLKGEVERLREALSKIADGDSHHDGAAKFMAIARAALAASPNQASLGEPRAGANSAY